MSFCWKWCGDSSMPSDQETGSGKVSRVSTVAFMALASLAKSWLLRHRELGGLQPHHRTAEQGEIGARLPIRRQIVCEGVHACRLARALGQEHLVDHLRGRNFQVHDIDRRTESIDQRGLLREPLRPGLG